MKINIHKKLISVLKSKTLLALSGGLILMSCGAYIGGYTETDGIYYDPNSDTLPVILTDSYGNQVGNYYDYQNTNNGIIRRGLQNQQLQSNRYRNDNWNSNATSSDWGVYTGTETNYNVWSSPWDMGLGFSPWGWGIFGMNYGFGWGMGMQYGLGMSFGWDSPWSMGYYDPFMRYSPWNRGGMYGMGISPWSWGMNRFYNPYGMYGGWGMGVPIYGNKVYTTPYARSGAVGGFRSASPAMRNNIAIGGTYNSGFRTPSSGYEYNNTYGRNQQSSRGQAFRPNTAPRPNYESRDYQMQNRSFNNSNNVGTFRSGSSGGFRSGASSSGGFRGGMDSSGGTRTGGFR